MSTLSLSPGSPLRPLELDLIDLVRLLSPAHPNLPQDQNQFGEQGAGQSQGQQEDLSRKALEETLKDILGADQVTQLDARGASPRRFTGVASLERALPHHITFFAHGDKDGLEGTRAGLCLIQPQMVHLVPKETVAWPTPRPHRDFLALLKIFHPQPSKPPPGIHPSAVVHPNAVVHPSAHVGACVVIGPDVHIGPECIVLAGAVLGPDVVLGASCCVQSLATLQHTTADQGCVFESGCRIGLDGFGFLSDDLGLMDLPHIGRVRLGAHCHIGANTAIDRGTLDDTVIGPWSRIDNLVQIGHNVQIGKQVVMAAMCGIAGSCVLGDGVMLGGQVGIADHVILGPGSRVSAKSGVMRDVPSGQTVAGFPAVPMGQWKRTIALQARLLTPKNQK
jgi:UDP-3-O-[3-hydroxymyristoyl] glucosamine N-acyltransferase